MLHRLLGHLLWLLRHTVAHGLLRLLGHSVATLLRHSVAHGLLGLLRHSVTTLLRHSVATIHAAHACLLTRVGGYAPCVQGVEEYRAVIGAHPFATAQIKIYRYLLTYLKLIDQIYIAIRQLKQHMLCVLTSWAANFQHKFPYAECLGALYHIMHLFQFTYYLHTAIMFILL